METKGITNLLLVGILAVLSLSAFSIYTFIESRKIERIKESKKSQESKVIAPIKKENHTKVIINAYATYPVPSGKILNPTKEQGKDIQYILPNGTKGEIVKWHEKYTILSSPLAMIDMFDESKVKILNGPMKGQVLLISHIYLTLE